MTAEVEVIAKETRNALLVPLQAVRELAPGQNAVFVVKSDGKLELRLVQVGLKDFVSAAVLSGVQSGRSGQPGNGGPFHADHSNANAKQK